MPAAVAVVQGASRGIGLELTRQMLGRGSTVVATCRNPSAAASLDALMAEYPKSLRVIPMDLAEPATIQAAATAVQSHHDKVSVLFNVSGILYDHPRNFGPEKTLAAVDPEWMVESFRVNAMGPLLVMAAFKSLLRQTSAARDTASCSKVVNYSARVGSIADNGLGGWYSYRVSKAALNQGMRTAAHELRRQGTCAISVHPGTVETDFTVKHRKNLKPGQLTSVDASVGNILNIVDKLTLDDSGRFYAFDGSIIPY